jgi:5-methyltetrahydrofolate--homocysteine methyltransferase
MLVGMTSTNDTDLLETLSERVVVGDGAMGTQLQAADLTLDDFQQPAPRRSRRNTFGCNLVNLGNYYSADKIRDLALKETVIAKRVGSRWASRRRATT